MPCCYAADAEKAGCLGNIAFGVIHNSSHMRLLYILESGWKYLSILLFIKLQMVLIMRPSSLAIRSIWHAI